ncbi:MAG: NlpC/P60 family protein [Chthoniobacterales bacterium]
MYKIYILLLFLIPALFAQDNPEVKKPGRPGVFTSATPGIPFLASRPKPGILQPEDIADFEKASASVQTLIRKALPLAGQGLSYKMGSADPGSGGMDCSGTVYYALQEAGISDVPRSSDEQYQWAWKAHTFRAVNSTSAKGFEWAELRPGALLFWTGTYNTGERNPPVSHVMIYLGKRKSDGRPVMFGASDGRSYEGKQRWGVGVFDFSLPASPGKARFIGYADIPGLL